MYAKPHALPGAYFFLLSLIPFFIAIKHDKGAELLGKLPFLKDIFEKPGKFEIIGFAIFFITAAFFRFHSLDTVPMGSFRDEGKAVKDAMDIIRGVTPNGADSALPIYIRAITDNPALYNYFMGGLFPFIGEGIMGARAATAIAGLLAAVSFYFLIRYMLGWKTAFFTSMFFAFGIYPVAYSRLVYHAGFAILPFIISLFYAVKIYNERKTADFIIFGIALALSVQTYQAARIVPVAYLLFIIGALFIDRGFLKANYIKLFAAFITAVIFMVPFLVYVMEHFDSFMMRASGLYLMQVQNRHHWLHENPILNYLISIKKVLLMFNHSGSNAINLGAYNGLPLMDFLTGIFAAAGFFMLLAAAFTGNLFGIIFVFTFILFAAAAAAFIEAPYPSRSVMTMPLIYIFTAFGLSGLIRSASSAGKKIIYVLISLAVVLAGVINYDKYFIKYGRHKYAYRAFETEKREAAEYVIKLGGSWQAIMTPYFMFGSEQNTPDVTIAFMAKKKNNYEKLTTGYNFPVNPAYGKNYVYILEREYFSMLPALQAYYPAGERVDFMEKYNDEKVIAFIAYKVPYEEALKGLSDSPERGLTARYYSGGNCGYGELLEVRSEPMILHEWAYFPKNANHFTVCWDGKIRIDTPGKYIFDVKTNERKELLIDNNLILSGNQTKAEIELSKGMHDIHVMYRNNGRNWFGLWWARPDKGILETVPMDNLYPQK
jgi:hypothetical protein